MLSIGTICRILTDHEVDHPNCSSNLCYLNYDPHPDDGKTVRIIGQDNHVHYIVVGYECEIVDLSFVDESNESAGFSIGEKYIEVVSPLLLLAKEADDEAE